MKKVLDPSTVAHYWANQTQPEARNAGGNFYYNDKTIYSYGSHFPIATIDNRNEQRTVLFTTRGYSNTTTKHLHLAGSASSHLPRIYCNNPLNAAQNQHDENINSFEAEAKSISYKLPNAKKPEIYLQQIAEQKEALLKYVKYFGLKKKAYKHLHFINIVTKDGAIQATEKERKERIKAAKKAEKERELRNAELREKDLKNLLVWRKFQKHFKTEAYFRSYVLENTFLRYNKATEQIETSKDVKLPLDVAKRFYNWLLHTVKNGGCDGQCKKEILGYSVTTVNAEHIVIGCHDILWTEINAIAKKLGWVK